MIFYTGYNCDLESVFFFFFGKVKGKVVVRRLFFVGSRYVHGYAISRSKIIFLEF